MIPSGINENMNTMQDLRNEKYEYFLKYQTIPEALMMYGDSDKTAVISGEESITYTELIHRSRKLALALRSEGIQQGDRILLALNRSVSYIVALLGILYSGASYVASEKSWPKERVDYILKDSKALFILDEAKYAILMKKTCEGSLPLLKKDDEFAIYYTSGSTGTPKGCVTHHQVYFNFAVPLSCNTFANLIMENSERCFSVINFSYIGSIWDMSITLLCHKTMILATDEERLNPALLGRRIYAEEADVLNMPPSQVLSYIFDEIFRKGIRNIKYLSMGGEALNETSIQRLKEATDATLFHIYGASEIGTVAEAGIGLHRPDHIGNPVYGSRFYLLDAKGRQISDGMEGEICVGGAPAEFGYYIGNEVLTAQKFTVTNEMGRIYHTGDIGICNPDGLLSVIGRMDNMKKLHGQRIEFPEIELCMEGYPGIKRAAVDIRGEEPYAKLLAWFIADEPMEASKIRKHLSQKLPSYMIPIRFMQINEFPLNPNGKLDRKALPE